MSPELLDPKRFGLEDSRPTKPSDCCALGMVVYEVLSGERPFAPNSSPVVIRMILEGKRPGRPQGHMGEQFTDSIWEVTERCWEAQPGDRSNAKAVLVSLEEGRPGARNSIRNQSQVEFGGALDENQGPSHLQTHRDRQDFPQEPKRRTRGKQVRDGRDVSEGTLGG